MVTGFNVDSQGTRVYGIYGIRYKALTHSIKNEKKLTHQTKGSPETRHQLIHAVWLYKPITIISLCFSPPLQLVSRVPDVLSLSSLLS